MEKQQWRSNGEAMENGEWHGRVVHDVLHLYGMKLWSV
jgi:hypothetical protein